MKVLKQWGMALDKMVNAVLGRLPLFSGIAEISWQDRWDSFEVLPDLFVLGAATDRLAKESP